MRYFETFDKVYCINLKHREDRKQNIISECEKYNLGEITFFEAINGNTVPQRFNISKGCVGLIMSNIEIINDAKKNDYETILILEDDCYFTDEILKINDYLNVLPDDWDMFYLGGNHNVGWKGIKPPEPINEKIIKLHHTFTTHFIALKKHMYDVILNEIKNFNQPIDVVYTTLQKQYNVYCTSVNIAKQINGYSDIENKNVNYHNMIQ